MKDNMTIEYEDGRIVQLTEDDAPELDETWFANAKRGYDHLPDDAAQIVKRAIASQQGRPPSENPKKQVTIRLNPKVLEKLKADGKGWQTRLNALLEKHFGLDTVNE